MQKQTEKPSKSIIDRFSQGISDLASALHRREIGWSDLFCRYEANSIFLSLSGIRIFAIDPSFSVKQRFPFEIVSKIHGGFARPN
jgi:hypothetical protein